MLHRTPIVLGFLALVGAAAPPPSQPAATAEPITPIPSAPTLPVARVALGAALFADTRLSNDGRRSCATCHDLKTNGASAERLDPAPDGASLAFNTTTVFNSVFNYRLDWVGHVRTLEDQVQASLDRPDILRTSMADVLARLAADPATVAAFRNVYGHGPDGAAVRDAIATFERTLVTPGSPFDPWLEGDASALSAEAIQGYRLFQSVGCVSCHQGRNVGGNLLERAGIFRPLNGHDSPMLRVPSLRNVAVTAPYFSNGATATLPEAVRVMADVQLGRRLSDTQSAQIVAFLNSLTGQFEGRALTPAR